MNFISSDISEIQALYEDEVPSEGEETEIEVSPCSSDMRRYKFVNGQWKYIGTYRDNGQVYNEIREKTKDANKSCKIKTCTNLQKVLDAFDQGRSEDAKELLKCYINKYGPVPPPGTRRKPAQKTMSEYNKFISNELNRMKETNTDIEPKDRMKIAMQKWKSLKIPTPN